MGKGKWIRRAVDSQRLIFVNKKHKALWNFSMFGKFRLEKIIFLAITHEKIIQRT